MAVRLIKDRRQGFSYTSLGATSIGLGQHDDIEEANEGPVEASKSTKV